MVELLHGHIAQGACIIDDVELLASLLLALCTIRREPTPRPHARDRCYATQAHTATLISLMNTPPDYHSHKTRARRLVYSAHQLRMIQRQYFKPANFL